MFEGYLAGPGQTTPAVDEHGWFHTGDWGSLDELGRITFHGRLKDMLKIGGENVAAVELESFLASHPAVGIVQVVGVPDDHLAEVAAAFVEVAPGAELDRGPAHRVLPGRDRELQDSALRPLHRRVADVGHEDPEGQAPRAAARRARGRLDERGAAVDDQLGAGHVAGEVAREEEDRERNLARVRTVSERDIRTAAARGARHARRLHATGKDSVDADPRGCERLRQRPRRVDHPGLAGAVGDQAVGVRHGRRDRRDVDDRSALALLDQPPRDDLRAEQRGRSD